VTVPLIAKAVARKVLRRRYAHVQSSWRNYQRRRLLKSSGVFRINRSFVREYGLTVRRGHFKGMIYVDAAVTRADALVPKLLGSYESEISSFLTLSMKGSFQQIINVGAAEGYYAVGLARMYSSLPVFAFEIDPALRLLLRRVARENAVLDRMQIGSWCSIQTLRRLPLRSSLIICDCEGCEVEILQPELVPLLQDSYILVELHESGNIGVLDVMRNRFLHTHVIEVASSEERDPKRYPELAAFSKLDARLAISEERGGRMEWAWMAPKRVVNFDS
jgi:hypothetical protein